MKEREVYMLGHLSSLPTRKRKQYLLLCDEKFINFLSECALNIINGNVIVENIKQVQMLEKPMRLLCNKKASSKVRRKTLSSNKGLKLVSLFNKHCAKYLSKP